MSLPLHWNELRCTVGQGWKVTLSICFQQPKYVHRLCARKILSPRVVNNTVPLLSWNLQSIHLKERQERLENEKSEGLYYYFRNALITAKKSAHIFSISCLRPMLVNRKTVRKLCSPLLSNLLCFHLASGPNRVFNVLECLCNQKISVQMSSATI